MINDETNTEAVLVVYNLIAETFTKIDKWLLRRVFLLSLKNVKSLVKVIVGDWVVDHNCIFLYAHIIITWCLVWYRIYRRSYCNGGRQADSSKEKGKTDSDTMTSVTERSGCETDTTMGAYLDYQCDLTSTECDKERDHSGVHHVASSEGGDSVGRGSVDSQGNLISGSVIRVAIFSETKYPDGDWAPPLNKKSPSSIQTLEEALKDIIVFKSLDEQQFQMIINAMKLIEVTKGNVVIKEGGEGDYFYVVRSGVFEAGKYSKSGEWKAVKTYVNSGSFGELGLLYQQPRAMTVKCLANGELWALDRNSFKSIVVQETQKKRREYEEFVSIVPILSELTKEERLQVVDALEPRVFPAGSEVVKEGDQADGMYLVMQGEAKVTHGGSQVGRNLVRGDYFGEMALINRKPRAATVVADTRLNTAFIHIEAFERLLGPAIDIMKRNMAHYRRLDD